MNVATTGPGTGLGLQPRLQRMGPMGKMYPRGGPRAPVSRTTGTLPRRTTVRISFRERLGAEQWGPRNARGS